MFVPPSFSLISHALSQPYLPSVLLDLGPLLPPSLPSTNPDPGEGTAGRPGRIYRGASGVAALPWADKLGTCTIVS